MGRVNGKVAIVTGAARGLGEADARLLATEGARVVMTDIDDERGQAVEHGDRRWFAGRCSLSGGRKTMPTPY